MNIVQIVSFALVALFVIVILKQYKPEYAIFASLTAGLVILLFFLSKVSTVITLLEKLVNDMGMNQEFFKILLKITGIAYLIEFATNVCKDAGENAVASKVELARENSDCYDVYSYYFNVNGNNHECDLKTRD